MDEDASQRDAVDGLAGRPLSEAVDVVARSESRDPEAVRATLERISEDGAVSRGALKEEIARVSKVVSTPETRVELAADAFADAREAAAPVADYDAVRGRLDGFATELEALEQEVDDLSTRLRAIIDDRTASTLYETARALEQLAATADEMAQEADALRASIEEFEAWLEDPSRRHESLEADVDDLEASVEELADLVDDLATAIAEGSEHTDDLGPDWAVLTIRRRAFALMVEDLRAERRSIRRWHESAGVAVGTAVPDLDGQLDGLEESLTTLEDRLEALDQAGWDERFDDVLSSFERAVEEVEPPVDWASLQPTVESHCVTVEDRRE